MLLDLDPADLLEVRRRVVDPVTSAVLLPGELTKLTLAIEFPPALWWSSDTELDPGVWLRLSVGSEEFEHCLARPGFWLDSASFIAESYCAALQDWIMLDTRFGWSQQRPGPNCDLLPPPPPPPPGVRVVTVHLSDRGQVPLWESGSPVDPTTLPITAALVGDLLAWRDHAEDLAHAAEAAIAPAPAPTTGAGLWVRSVSERSKLTRESEADQRRQETIVQWRAWVDELEPARDALVARLRQELGDRFLVPTPPRLPHLS